MSNNIPDTKFQRSGNVNCWQRPVWESCPCCLQCLLLSHMWACATGDTSFFLKQLIVFMPELNEKDHRTVFIIDGKARTEWAHPRHLHKCRGEWVHIHMKVSLMKRLGGHKDKKAILGVFVLVPCCGKQTTQRSTKQEWRSSRTCSQKMPTTSWQKHAMWVTELLLHNSSMTTMKCCHCISLCVRVYTQCTQWDTSRRLHCVTLCAVLTTTQWICCVLGETTQTAISLLMGLCLHQKGLEVYKEENQREDRAVVQSPR